MCCLSLHPLSVCKFAFGFFKGGLGSALARVQNNKGQSTPAMATKKLMATKNTAGWAGVGLPNNCWVGWGRHSRWPQTHTLPKRGQSAPAMATKNTARWAGVGLPNNCWVGWGRHSRCLPKTAGWAGAGTRDGPKHTLPKKEQSAPTMATKNTAGWAGVGLPKLQGGLGSALFQGTRQLQDWLSVERLGRLPCLA